MYHIYKYPATDMIMIYVQGLEGWQAASKLRWASILSLFPNATDEYAARDIVLLVQHKNVLDMVDNIYAQTMRYMTQEYGASSETLTFGQYLAFVGTGICSRVMEYTESTRTLSINDGVLRSLRAYMGRQRNGDVHTDAVACTMPVVPAHTVDLFRLIDDLYSGDDFDSAPDGYLYKPQEVINALQRTLA